MDNPQATFIAYINKYKAIKESSETICRTPHYFGEDIVRPLLKDRVNN